MGSPIVGADNSRCTVSYGIGKNLTGVYLSPVDKANRYHSCRDNLIGSIKRNTDKILLFPVCMGMSLIFCMAKRI
jgi:hypothetical protein